MLGYTRLVELGLCPAPTPIQARRIALTSGPASSGHLPPGACLSGFERRTTATRQGEPSPSAPAGSAQRGSNRRQSRQMPGQHANRRYFLS